MPQKSTQARFPRAERKPVSDWRRQDHRGPVPARASTAGERSGAVDFGR
ncbi:unnamed protein product [Soboliphyme baturini]|uniref:Rep protein n=1 Tax=Soboliphyme baturini TaxID=241478 RepID=A0A183ISP6_9BILA|nr:unnamed protein product [Soboliphyme baturini]